MTATGFEVSGSRKGTADRCTRQYWLQDATDEDDVFDFIAGLPAVVAGLPFADFDYQEREEINNAGDLHDYEITCNWGLPQNSGSSQPKDTTEYKFNFQAPGGHIKQALATIADYADPAYFAFGAPPMQGSINVTFEKGVEKVEGINLQPPHEVFTLSYKVGSDVITGAYQTLVESLCGKVNSVSFRGRDAGSVMLVRATGGRDTSGIWSIEFGFGYIANDTNIPVGDNITVATKDGFDLLWAFYSPVKDGTTKRVNQNPTAAYVVRIFQRADLNALNLPP